MGELFESLLGQLQAESVVVGILVGIVLVILLGSAIGKARWGWGLAKRPLQVQDEVQEMYRQSWRDSRTGCKGCMRAIVLGLLFIGVCWAVIYSLGHLVPW
jgi:hypothetical protein